MTSAWIKKDNLVELKIEIPANTTATVVLPKNTIVVLNGEPLKITDDGNLQVKVGSGKHQIEYTDQCVLNL